jgi:cobalamin biosynthesis protein CobD/CbiB
LLSDISIVPLQGFHADHIADDMGLCIYSSAYTVKKNDELRAAMDSGKPVFFIRRLISKVKQIYGRNCHTRRFWGYAFYASV